MTWPAGMAVALALALVGATSVAAGCGGTVPATHFYQLEPGAPAVARSTSPGPAAAAAHAILVVEPLAADGIYDDDRIVYRTSRYGLSRYTYHRWSAPPGLLIGRFLRLALLQSARFRAVTADMTPDASAVLRGRIEALEEIDLSPRHWVGHVALVFQLEDARTGSLLWTGRYDRQVSLAHRDPAGLAAAVSAALGQVAADLAPRLAAALAPTRDRSR